VYTSEIEKLEKRWAENPKGRNFAPLADAYRKAGELDRAFELCKSGLERHPDYVSAHIVYGRCYLDQKNDTAASQVFRKVLELDPENVLGLKLLAEIAERGGRYEEAAEWLSRLLAADPMNGDAAEALTRTKRKVAQVPAKPMAPPTAKVSVTAPGPKPEFVVEHTPEEPVSPHLESAQRAGDIETFDGTLDFNAAAHDAAKADGLEVQEEVELKPQDLVVEGLAATQYESGMFGAPPEPAAAPPEPEPDLPNVDLPLIMPEDLAPPRASEAASAPPGRSALPPPPPPAAPPPPVPAPPAAPMPAAVALSDDDGAADAAALSRAEPVLTETMAELYLKQGHREDALRVYQALLAQRPDDARLHARVDALSPGRQRTGGAGGGRGTGESVPAFLKRILAGRPPAAGDSPPEPAAVAESPLERAFAVAPPDVQPGPELATRHEGTRHAEDTISLDDVFGEVRARGPRPVADGAGSQPQASPVPSAAAPPAAPAPPAPAPTQTGGFSFDQFFGAPPSRGGADAGTAGGAGGRPSARPSGAKAHPPLEDEGDLDQFQAWLKGLKS